MYGFRLGGVIIRIRRKEAVTSRKLAVALSIATATLFAGHTAVIAPQSAVVTEAHSVIDDTAPDHRYLYRKHSEDSRKVYEVTAYTAGYESTQKRRGQRGYGITASGTRATEGRTAACPASIPFGTVIELSELGERYVCEDRGGAITDGHVDLYVRTVKAARAFGRQRLAVEIEGTQSGAD